MTKKCVKCGERKDESCFSGRSGSKKLRGVCKECHNARCRKRYLESIDGTFKRKQRAKLRESDPKTCIKCDQSKPLSEFNWHNKEKGQHRNFCKECQNAWARKRNRTSHAKVVRKGWEDENADRIQEYKDLYKKLDREDPVRLAKKRAYHREYWLKQYGLTSNEYDEILKKQGYKCAICGTMKPGRNRKNFAVDHCHKTGKVRGLLCFSCNVSIGHFEDKPEILRQATNYLES